MPAEVADLFEGRALAAPAPPCIGIEQEFEVRRGEERIDFRDIIHMLQAPGVRIDPGDVNAYRLENGLALTCDEAEAELASPPIPLEPGFAWVVASHAALMRRTLRDLLSEGMSIRGYSTHLSVSVPGPPDIELAERWARTFGPLFGVLADRAESQGIYVRPRPGRLEFCSEFMEGLRLEAAAAFAAGSVFAALEGLWPEVIRLELLPCRERFGFRVHRSAAGFDLYTAGRDGLLDLADGGSLPLGPLFDRAAASSIAAVARRSRSADVHELRAVASGVRPLGIEAGDEPVQTWDPPPDLGYGLAGQRWQSHAASVVPWRATWDYTMFEVRAAGAPPRYLSVPSTALPRLAALVERDVDEFARAVSARPAAEFTTYEQTGMPVVFSSPPAKPEVLLPAEVPVTGPAKSGRAWPKPARIGKMAVIPPILLRPSGPLPPIPLAPFPPTPAPNEPATPVAGPGRPAPLPTPPAPGGRPPWGVIGIVGAALLGLAGVAAVIVAGGGESQDEPSTPVAAVAQSVTATPAKPPAEPTETVKPAETTAPTSSAVPTALPAGVTPAPTTPTAAVETPVATSPATAQPSETALPSATPSPIPSNTPRPTETPLPTFTPSPISPTATPCQGAACI